ncbi:MAG: response regulator transcription factor [Gemmatimonadetes bacterium]|nr:response regulator transcription factor [Gemmatimonadota bacterium]
MKLLILCQEKILSDALKVLLEDCSQLDLEVVGETDSGLEGVDLARSLRPDVALISFQLQELNGIDATRRILEVAEEVGVLILASDPRAEPLQEAFEAGALGYVTMDGGAEELIRALQAVAEGKNYLCPDSATALVETTLSSEKAAEDPVFALLTPREREVLQLLSEGLGAREVAEKLHISTKTVDTHRRKVMQKLETDSLAELVKHAIRAGLTTLKL